MCSFDRSGAARRTAAAAFLKNIVFKLMVIDMISVIIYENRRKNMR